MKKIIALLILGISFLISPIVILAQEPFDTGKDIIVKGTVTKRSCDRLSNCSIILKVGGKEITVEYSNCFASCYKVDPEIQEGTEVEVYGFAREASLITLCKSEEMMDKTFYIKRIK